MSSASNRENIKRRKFMDIEVYCPHCGDKMYIEQIKCGIFRHGYIISLGKQLSPHAKQHICEMHLANNDLLGCGKPFRVIVHLPTAEPAETEEKPVPRYEAVICDYI